MCASVCEHVRAYVYVCVCVWLKVCLVCQTLVCECVCRRGLWFVCWAICVCLFVFACACVRMCDWLRVCLSNSGVCVCVYVCVCVGMSEV